MKLHGLYGVFQFLSNGILVTVSPSNKPIKNNKTQKNFLSIEWFGFDGRQEDYYIDM